MKAPEQGPGDHRRRVLAARIGADEILQQAFLLARRKWHQCADQAKQNPYADFNPAIRRWLPSTPYTTLSAPPTPKLMLAWTHMSKEIFSLRTLARCR